MKHFTTFSVVVLLTLPFLFLSCNDDDDDNGASPNDAQNQTGNVTFSFSHNIDGQYLLFDSMKYTNKAGEQYGVKKLEYILTDFRLFKANGSIVAYDTSHYVNPNKDGTKSLTFENLPKGDYNAMAFTFGIDSSKNQTNKLPNTQNFNNMSWPEINGGGYHYMRMNGVHDSSGSEDGFTTHLGHSKKWDMSTNPPSPTGPLQDFSFEVKIDNINLSVNDNTWKLMVGMDLNKWYENPNTYKFSSLENEGIMMNQTIQQTLMENGRKDLFSLKSKKQQ